MSTSWRSTSTAASAWPGPIRASAELTGHTAEELIELGGFFTLVLEADRAELQRRNQRLLAGQQVVGALPAAPQGRRGPLGARHRPARMGAGRRGRHQRGRCPARPHRRARRRAGHGHSSSVRPSCVASTLEAFVCLIDTQGTHPLGRRAGSRSALGERLAQHVGRGLGSFLTGAELAFWLDWLEEAAESGLPSRFRIRCVGAAGRA